MEMKLKLIPILTRMHHDISTATQVEALIITCIKFCQSSSPPSDPPSDPPSLLILFTFLLHPPQPLFSPSSSFLLTVPSHLLPSLLSSLFTLSPHPISSPSLQVRDLCVKLLLSYPSLSFVTAILHTLTELAIATVVHMVDQVGGGYSNWFPYLLGVTFSLSIPSTESTHHLFISFDFKTEP